MRGQRKNPRKAVQPFENKKRKIDIFKNYEANGVEKIQRKLEIFSTLISKKSIVGTQIPSICLKISCGKYERIREKFLLEEDGDKFNNNPARSKTPVFSSSARNLVSSIESLVMSATVITLCQLCKDRSATCAKYISIRHA